MKKEEIIKEWQLKYGYVNTEYVVKGWNDAIDMAAEEAETKTVKYTNDIEVDKKSITDLKFDI